MTRQARAAVERVLKEAPKTPQFFDLCPAEQMIFMLSMAFSLGKKQVRYVCRRGSKTNRHQRV